MIILEKQIDEKKQALAGLEATPTLSQ